MSSSCDEKIPRIEHHQNNSDVSITICGYWSLNSRERLRLLRRWESLVLQWKDVMRFEIKCDESLVWDSSLVVFLRNAKRDLSVKGGRVVFLDLPVGLNKLLSLADEGQKRNKGQKQDPPSDGFPSMEALLKPLDFLGALVISFLNLVRGRSVMRWRDFFASARNCSASALPIVTLISFLTGVTMAFVGSVQLEKFNATIYVADLVSLAMVREMGALMVAIIMAGRTGAAFAAELGNMNLNEEIDSLETFGICSISFLVLPRTLALFVMTPLLTIYADIVGILGGLLVGTLVMGFSALHYLEQTQSALTDMWEVYSGVSKSLFFGLIIGFVGCYKGVFSGRDSASLGKSVTSAVVISVTLIIIADAFFETAFSLLELR
jgi:phospholipid/cholesterol/gamma-HCH transport system permease protein